MKPYDFRKNGVDYTFHPLPDMTEDAVYEIHPEAKVKPAPAPAPTPTPVENTGLHVRIVKQELSSMNVEYKNGTPDTATFKVRVGSTDRPNRAVTGGKTVLSTYTTTVKTGFAGQKITVLHLESGKILLEQVL